MLPARKDALGELQELAPRQFLHSGFPYGFGYDGDDGGVDSHQNPSSELSMGSF